MARRGRPNPPAPGPGGWVKRAPRPRGGWARPNLPTPQVRRGELLLSLRLLAEARRCAAAALRTALRSHDPLSAADTRLLLAQIAMADGHPAEAERLARSAAEAFTAHGQHSLAAFARLHGVRAAVARGARRLPPLDEVDALV